MGYVRDYVFSVFISGLRSMAWQFLQNIGWGGIAVLLACGLLMILMTRKMARAFARPVVVLAAAVVAIGLYAWWGGHSGPDAAMHRPARSAKPILAKRAYRPSGDAVALEAFNAIPQIPAMPAMYASPGMPYYPAMSAPFGSLPSSSHGFSPSMGGHAANPKSAVPTHTAVTHHAAAVPSTAAKSQLPASGTTKAASTHPASTAAISHPGSSHHGPAPHSPVKPHTPPPAITKPAVPVSYLPSWAHTPKPPAATTHQAPVESGYESAMRWNRDGGGGAAHSASVMRDAEVRRQADHGGMFGSSHATPAHSGGGGSGFTASMGFGHTGNLAVSGHATHGTSPSHHAASGTAHHGAGSAHSPQFRIENGLFGSPGMGFQPPAMHPMGGMNHMPMGGMHPGAVHPGTHHLGGHH